MQVEVVVRPVGWRGGVPCRLDAAVPGVGRRRERLLGRLADALGQPLALPVRIREVEFVLDTHVHAAVEVLVKPVERRFIEVIHVHRVSVLARRCLVVEGGGPPGAGKKFTVLLVGRVAGIVDLERQFDRFERRLVSRRSQSSVMALGLICETNSSSSASSRSAPCWCKVRDIILPFGFLGDAVRLVPAARPGDGLVKKRCSDSVVRGRVGAVVIARRNRFGFRAHGVPSVRL